MTDREIKIVYKDMVIRGYKGSNYAYVGNRIFNSFNSAKRHITKVMKHFNNDKELTCLFYKGER